MITRDERDNHSIQMNPNNELYYKSSDILKNSDDDYHDDDDYAETDSEDDMIGDPWPWYGED